MTGLLKRKEDKAVAKAKQAAAPLMSPKVDIVENGHFFTLYADMPGVGDNNAEVELEGHELTIKGTLSTSVDEKYRMTRREFRNRSYERTFTLGDSIDREKIKAVMKNGVLNLTLPKVKEAKPKKIKVIAG